MKLNHFENIHVVNKAVSNTSDKLVQFNSEFGVSAMSRATENGDHLTQKKEVGTVHIDGYTDDYIDIIKFSIHGYEYRALQGMDRLLSSQKIGVLLFHNGYFDEIPDSTPDTMIELFQFLHAREYECFWSYRLGSPEGITISINASDTDQQHFIKNVMLDTDWFKARSENSGATSCLPTESSVINAPAKWKSKMHLLRKLLKEVFKRNLFDGANPSHRDQFTSRLRSEHMVNSMPKYKEGIVDTNAIFNRVLNVGE